MTLESVFSATKVGHKVLVETNVGIGINVSDDVYEKVGAVIMPNAEEIFSIADMIVKVKV